MGAIAALLSALLQYLKQREKQETIEDRVRLLTTSLRNASKVVSDIEREIHDRQELAEKLQQDIKTYNKIAELEKDDVEAVAQVLRGELRKEGRRGFLQNLALNILFFVLGVIVTLLLL